MHRRILSVLIIILGLYTLTEAQTYKYWITFKDKSNSPYSVSYPQQFLTQRSLQRRQNQGVLIDFKDIPVNSWYIDTLKDRGFVILHASRWFNSVAIQSNDTNAVNALLSIPFVDRITLLYNANSKKKKRGKKEGNSIAFTYTQTSKNQKVTKSANSRNTINYGNAYRQIEMLKGEMLHNQGFQGQGMVIAVLDAGFWKVDTMSAFDSLWKSGQILGVRDFVEANGNVFQKSTHGQMVLSTMGANVPGSMVGTAPKASYWLLRSEDATSEYPIEEANWAVAAEFADSVGADIINSSLGYTYFDDLIFGHEYAEINGKTAIGSKAAAIAAAKGIIVVNSAGNSAQQQWRYIGVPADADNILTVGAVNENMEWAPFSSIGPAADGRVKPDVAAMGVATIVATDNGYIPGNGTSFASPVLAGMVACLWQANPTLSNMQIMNAVKRSANQYTSPDSLLGYGVPDFNLANILLTSGEKGDMENKHLTALPNPFTDYLQVIYESSGSQTASMELYSCSGKKLWEKNQLSIKSGFNNYYLNDLSSLSKGIYILVFKTDSKIYHQKVIKM